MDADATTNADAALRAQLHTMWGSVAGGWGDHADYVDRRGASISDAMLAASAPAPGERVLELACGPGSVGIAAAPLVGPAGEVVLSDVAEEMVAVAAARVAALGLTNVSTRVLDLEDIADPDDGFDVVVCREGLMFALDPARATREVHRVLRPGGRVAIAVWGPPDENPWLSLVFEAVTAQLGVPIPPPGIPGPFALADATRLAGLLTDAGFDGVEIRELPSPVLADSFDEWWSRTIALAGPLGQVLAGLPDEVVAELHARLVEAVEHFRVGERLELPGLTLLATAAA